MNARNVLLVSLTLISAAGTARAELLQSTYRIAPGGQYTYKPSPWTGIPGGVPSPFQLDFGIGGTFTYEFDSDSSTARLLSLDLTLTGNEAIQAAPPVNEVTPAGVEAYLAGHTFVEDFIGGLVHLQSSTHEGLKLTDSLTGNLLIRGGFDATPVDGPGMLFDFSAVAIPEPAGIGLMLLAALALARARRREQCGALKAAHARNTLPTELK